MWVFGARVVPPSRGRQRLISAKIPDPAVQSSGDLPQREAVAIVVGVATATAINADDVNQILGDLHYAKVNLMGISYGRPSSRSPRGVTHAPSAAAVPASARRLGRNGRA
jgi:hypothetical protein